MVCNRYVLHVLAQDGRLLLRTETVGRNVAELRAERLAHGAPVNGELPHRVVVRDCSQDVILVVHRVTPPAFILTKPTPTPTPFGAQMDWGPCPIGQW